MFRFKLPKIFGTKKVYKQKEPSPQDKVYSKANALKGMKEIVGSNHNPEIVDMFKDVGHGWVTDDETAWCAAFVGSVLKSCGLPYTGKLNARSYLDWGVPISLDQAKKGDVVVFSRGNPKGWQGHVAFYSHHTNDVVYVLGGNQSNAVNVKGYARSRLLGVRRVR